MEKALDQLQERAGRLYRMILFGAPEKLVRIEMELVQEAIEQYRGQHLLAWLAEDPGRKENLRRALWPDEEV